MARDYKKEYANYQGTPEQKKRRTTAPRQAEAVAVVAAVATASQCLGK